MADPLAVTPYITDRTTINSLPGELLLYIASHVTQADAVCLCLATKRCFDVLASEYFPRMKIQAVKDITILNALERDLPWNHYLCCICRRLHKFAYGQGMCGPHLYPWSSPHNDASRILQNNIRVLKRKYLAESLAQGSSPSDLSLSYHYGKPPLGFWGYLEVKPGQNGNLYLRCQNWLRWTDNMWKHADGDKYFHEHFHDGFLSRRSCQHNLFESSRYFRSRSCIALDDILPKPSVQPLPMAQADLPTADKFQNTQPGLPKIWSSVPMFSCARCHTDIAIHLGFSPVPLDQEQNGSNQADRQTSSAWTKRATAAMRLTSWTKGRSKLDIANGRPPSRSDSKLKHWCDTMVITEWRCIGSPDLLSEAYDYPAPVEYPHANWIRSEYLSARVTGLDYVPGAARKVFDGIPNQPYHPTQTKLNPLPLWISEAPSDQGFEMPILMSQVGPKELMPPRYPPIFCLLI